MRYVGRVAVAALSVFVLLGAGCKSSEPAGPPPPATPLEAPVREGLEPFEPVVGDTIDEAQEWLADNPTTSPGRPQTRVVSVRPIRIDGEELAITEDLRADRLNVIVDKGVITALDGIY